VWHPTTHENGTGAIFEPEAGFPGSGVRKHSQPLDRNEHLGVMKNIKFHGVSVLVSAL
jgi:hypothetical protein